MTDRIIIGIDPGIADAGYGVIAICGRVKQCLAVGSIQTSKKLIEAERLKIIYEKLEELVLKFKPVEAGIEKIYFSKNVKTAISVAQARGVLIACLAKHGVKIYEFSPQAVKIAVAGSGNADKSAVQTMITKLLRLKSIPKPDDAADALAIAFTQAVTRR